MRKSKFSETQIVGILKDAESGVAVADLLRKYGVSKATFFKWRSKYGGASISDVKRLRAAPRQPRAGAAADVSPEAFISGKVCYRTVRLTGELTSGLASGGCRR
jgi:putative transposase